MAASNLLRLKSGQFIRGYTLHRVTSIPELALTTFEFNHEKTGAKHLHLARDDPNKAFSVQFRTTPYDSTGVAHILEHIALCGSEKYPVRDPFFKMVSRSLSTFMNAFTASDWTMYPFSTLNEKDFYNLMSVYMDAAFNPKLSEMDFKQEGWRLEHEDVDDPKSKLMIKGVVFNEMKGVFSNSSNIFSTKVQNSLLPSGTYGIVSGGDPRDIPVLTWEQLKKFHRDHYHPSNARFYTYGDLDVEEALEFIDSNYLHKFEKIEVDTSVTMEPRWKKRKSQEFSCPPDPMAVDQDKQTSVCVSFMLNDVSNVYGTFVLNVVSRLLTEGDNSPLFINLMESGLGSDFAPLHGFDTSTKATTFHAGLKGVAEADVEKVTEIIDKTLHEVVKDGFPKERIEAILHQIELSLKHEGSNFGLELILSLCYPWNHDADPVSLLQINAMVDRLRHDIEDDPRFLIDYVKAYFLENNHKLVSIMRPDPNHNKELEEKYTKILEIKTRDIDEERNMEIHRQSLHLRETQNKQEDLSCLPCLQLSDINDAGEREPFTNHTVSSVPVQMNEWATNGVTYFRAMFDLSKLSSRLAPYVPLFGAILPKLGGGGLSYREMSQAIELRTSGLSTNTTVSDDPYDSLTADPRTGLMLSTYCLDRNLQEALTLWQKLLLEADWSTHDRIQTLIQMEAADLSSVLVSQGHHYAVSHSAAGLSKSASLSEMWGGVQQLRLMKSVAMQAESDNKDDLQKLIGIFQEISEAVIDPANLRVSINTTPENVDKSLHNLETFVSTIPKRDTPPSYIFNEMTQHGTSRNHIVMPFGVNYMAQAHRIGDFRSSEYATCTVLSKLLTWKYLHKQIREKGGAYGGGSAARPGQFLFYSYRDPNSTKTLEEFNSSLKWIEENQITPQDLMEAKLSVFKEIDRPTPAGSRGARYFLTGITDDMRHSHRQAILAVTVDEVKAAAAKLRSHEPSEYGQTGIGPANPELQSRKGWATVELE